MSGAGCRSVSCRQSGADGGEMSFQRSRGGAVALMWQGCKFLFGGREKSFIANRVEAEELARARFAKLLRDPFPGSQDFEIARYWAVRLGTTERTVRNWLACDTSASITDIFIVGAMHGVWSSAAILVGDDSRAEIMGRISQR